MIIDYRLPYEFRTEVKDVRFIGERLEDIQTPESATVLWVFEVDIVGSGARGMSQMVLDVVITLEDGSEFEIDGYDMIVDETGHFPVYPDSVVVNVKEKTIKISF